MAVMSLVAMLGLAGCIENRDDGPGPSPTVLNVAGTWNGSLSVQGVQAQMTWLLAQTNSTVTGSALVGLPTGTVLMNGTLNGTVTGAVLTYTIAVGAGGIPSQPGCTGQLGGTANLVGTSPVSAMNGNYTVVTSSCAIPFTSGSFTMTR